jgi:hypothetical protein
VEERRLGVKGSGLGEGWGGKGEEMTQTLYAHLKNIKNFLKRLPLNHGLETE